MKRVVLSGKFYVYEHWRPDKDICFYVGKGHGNRAYDASSRNNHHARIVAKLSRLGMCVEVRLYKSGLGQAESWVIEKERIAFWRACGVELANHTNGGEGVAGFTRPWAQRLKMSKARRGIMHSETTKAKMSKAHKGKKLSSETKHRISLAHKGKAQAPHSSEHKAKIGAKSRGRKHTVETKAKMSQNAKNRSDIHLNRLSAALRNRPLPLEHRAKLSEAAKHRPPISEQTRAKLSAASKARKRTPEWLAKLSVSIKASWPKRAHRPGGAIYGHSAETRARMSALKKGRKLTAEHKQKISAGNKACWAENRHGRQINMSSIVVQ